MRWLIYLSFVASVRLVKRALTWLSKSSSPEKSMALDSVTYRWRCDRCNSHEDVEMTEPFGARQLPRGWVRMWVMDAAHADTTPGGAGEGTTDLCDYCWARTSSDLAGGAPHVRA